MAHAQDAARGVVRVDEYMLAEKGLSAGEAHSGMRQLIETARSVGLEFDYANLKATNSARAHQLIHFARTAGRGPVADERLFQAYFERGEHIGHLDVLREIAGEIGLDRDAAEKSLRADEYLDAVRADEAEAASLGATGVPFFVVNRDVRTLRGADECVVPRRSASRSAGSAMTTTASGEILCRKQTTMTLTNRGDPTATACVVDSCVIEPIPALQEAQSETAQASRQ